MSEKRRDNKGRILQKGESQRSDNRYMFRYTDIFGKTQTIYSWRLVRSDSVPYGKRDNGALRDLKKQILRDLNDGIAPNGNEYTVLDLVKKYVSQKAGVKETTYAGYKTTMNYLSKDPFGMERIDKIKPSDAKAWLINLQKNGKSYAAIHNIRGVLRPAFRMAVDDDLLRKNPFDFELTTVIVDDTARRDALTNQQEKKFLSFIKNDPHYCKYYDGMFILFHTGMRISEFTGLTLDDIDLNKKTIRIDHQLQKTGTHVYIEKSPKTDCGNRILPMTREVCEAFRRIIRDRKAPSPEPVIDGYSGFLFFDKDGKPMVAMHWEKYFQHALAKHNRIYKEQLPKITPHVCRHTYCTNMVKKGMSPKALQYLMGHRDVSTTLNYYTHFKLNDAKEALENAVKGRKKKQ